MKKTLTNLFVAILLVGFISACSITVPVAATSNPVGSKTGKQKATTFLYILSFGQDASIMSAAKNGGISKISTVDQKQGNILGLVQTYETIVTGE